MKVYSRLAELVMRYQAQIASDDNDVFNQQYETAGTINDHMRNRMPSGNGFDNGTILDMDRSTPDKLVFTTGLYHMNEHGSYDGWTQHTVIVRPNFITKFTITVSGRNRNGVKDYIAEVFSISLSVEV